MFSQTKTEKVKEMLVLSGTSSFGKEMLQQMLPTFKKAYPTIPDEFFVRFMEKVKVEDLQNLIIPIYESRFSESEIDDIIQFYKSPTGRKLTSKMSDIFKESQIVGSIWGEKLAGELIEELQEEFDEAPPVYTSPPPPMKAK